MRKAAALTLATTIAALSLASNATAQPEYATRIPNGSAANCVFCHPGGNTTLKNEFALDSAVFLGKPAATWWPGLVDLDSDGDGQTNGQELGDPCNDWVVGETPGRTTGISNPGEQAAVSATPDVPSCDGSGGAGGAPTTTTGTTTSDSNPAGGTTTTTGDNPAGGGEGGEGPGSVGAGKADPPPSTNAPGSCSMASTPQGGALAVAFFAAIALFFARAARPRRSNSK